MPGKNRVDIVKILDVNISIQNIIVQFSNRCRIDVRIRSRANCLKFSAFGNKKNPRRGFCGSSKSLPENRTCPAVPRRGHEAGSPPISSIYKIVLDSV
jgi:hypothetical protein